MNYVIEAAMSDGANWFMGLFPGPKGMLCPKWSPYYEDAQKLELNDAKIMCDTYDLAKTAQADIKHISDAKQFQSAHVVQDSGFKYMARPVRVRKLDRGDIFIEMGYWYEVVSVRRGHIHTRILGMSGDKPEPTHSRRSNLWVLKVFTNTKTPI